MSILTSVPSSTRKPGTYAEFDNTSKSSGLTPITRRAVMQGARLNAAAWIASTAYVIGDWVTNSGNVYRCTVAGTSAGSGGPTQTSGTATDGTVTWIFVQAALKASLRTAYQMFTEADADAYFGKGSELALMVRAALKATKMAGKSPELWATAEDDAGGSARKKETFTVTGTAGESKDIAFRIAGR